MKNRTSGKNKPRKDPKVGGQPENDEDARAAGVASATSFENDSDQKSVSQSGHADNAGKRGPKN
jgi:hypothetical protein